ncbi:protein FAM107B [Lycodopsis pacificus]
MQTHQSEQQYQYSELQAPSSQQQSEEESSNLITPQKPPNPLTASKSHQELHRELRMTHKTRVSQEEKTELQSRGGLREKVAREFTFLKQQLTATLLGYISKELQAQLEKRRWEQGMKASRDQEEAKKNRSPLHRELLKRQQRLENLERDKGQQREGPEFLRVKEGLRRTAVLE